MTARQYAFSAFAAAASPDRAPRKHFRQLKAAVERRLADARWAPQGADVVPSTMSGRHILSHAAAAWAAASSVLGMPTP